MGSLDEIQLARLHNLCAARAVSGYEETLASEVTREAGNHADEVGTDSLGNVIASRNSVSPS